MATRPNLVPEDQPWLVFEEDFTLAFQASSKRECLEWIMSKRLEGDKAEFLVYSPDSRHMAAVVNQIAWERVNG